MSATDAVILEGECHTCGEFGEGVMPRPEERCPAAKRPCQHHCNHVWIHDTCCWCNATINDDGDLVVPEGTPMAEQQAETNPIDRIGHMAASQAGMWTGELRHRIERISIAAVTMAGQPLAPSNIHHAKRQVISVFIDFIRDMADDFERDLHARGECVNFVNDGECGRRYSSCPPQTFHTDVPNPNCPECGGPKVSSITIERGDDPTQMTILFEDSQKRKLKVDLSNIKPEDNLSDALALRFAAGVIEPYTNIEGMIDMAHMAANDEEE